MFFKKLVDRTGWREIKGVKDFKIEPAISYQPDPCRPIKDRGSLSFEISGISPETAEQIKNAFSRSSVELKESLEAFSKTMDEVAQQMMQDVRDTDKAIHKHMLGEVMTDREIKLYKAYRYNYIMDKVRERFKRSKTVYIQNIDHIHGSIFVCEHNGSYYWSDCNGVINLADIRSYRKISLTLYHNLKLYNQTDNVYQKYSLNRYYTPEEVEARGYKSIITPEEFVEISSL